MSLSETARAASRRRLFAHLPWYIEGSENKSGFRVGLVFVGVEVVVDGDVEEWY